MALRKGEDAIDRWSIVHAGSGVGLAVLGVSVVPASALLVGFEALEAVLRRFKTEEGGLFEYESWPNVIADLILGLAGYLATFWFMQRVGWDGIWGSLHASWEGHG